MNYGEFAKAYRANIPEEERYPGPYPTEMQMSREWSHLFGTLLHNHLSDGEPLVEDQIVDLFSRYGLWVATNLPDLSTKILSGDDPNKFRAFQELNFHRQNLGMIGMWAPILRGAWGRLEKRDTLAFTEDSVAIMGAIAYLEREKYANIDSNYFYFSKENEPYRRSFEGRGNEADFAVGGIHLIKLLSKKYPDLTLVPGPMQFEAQRGRRAKYNSDFVVLDVRQKKAIGVQVKSSIPSDANADQYSNSHVVVIDATHELGNAVVRRTAPKHSNRRIVTWSGLISAAHVANFPTRGPRREKLEEQYGKERIQHLQRDVKKALGTIGSRKAQAQQQIGPRIIARLYDD